MTALAAALAALSLVPVAAYFAYTLAEQVWLRPLVTAPVRLVLLGVATAGCAVATVLADSPAALALLCVPALAMAWVVRRQWLWPRAAVELRPSDVSLSGDLLVAVVESGDAVPLDWLAALRTAHAGDVLLVHCGLSGALSAFQRPADSALAAVLPHPTGFWIGRWTPRWDGVDGSALRGADVALVRAPLALCRLATWRSHHPAGRLLAPPTPRAARAVKPLTRTARRHGAERGLGLVVQDRWTALDSIAAADVARPDASHAYLGRWAAMARGLRCAIAAQRSSLEG